MSTDAVFAHFYSSSFKSNLSDFFCGFKQWFAVLLRLPFGPCSTVCEYVHALVTCYHCGSDCYCRTTFRRLPSSWSRAALGSALHECITSYRKTARIEIPIAVVVDAYSHYKLPRRLLQWPLVVELQARAHGEDNDDQIDRPYAMDAGYVVFSRLSARTNVCGA